MPYGEHTEIPFHFWSYQKLTNNMFYIRFDKPDGKLKLNTELHRKY